MQARGSKGKPLQVSASEERWSPFCGLWTFFEWENGILPLGFVLTRPRHGLFSQPSLVQINQSSNQSINKNQVNPAMPLILLDLIKRSQRRYQKGNILQLRHRLPNCFRLHKIRSPMIKRKIENLGRLSFPTPFRLFLQYIQQRNCGLNFTRGGRVNTITLDIDATILQSMFK